MLNEIDEGLRGLLRSEVVDGTEVDVVFEAPTRDWASRRSGPTVNVYLYDIREDLRRRSVGVLEEKDEQGRVVRRREPPRYFRLAYLITAWTQRAEDEHRLLASILACFLRHEVLPQDGDHTPHLLDQGLAVGLQLAYPPSEDRHVSDVWSSLGGDLKPSLDLIVTVPIDTERFSRAAKAVLEPLFLRAEAQTTGKGSDGLRQGRRKEPPPQTDGAAREGDSAAASERPRPSSSGRRGRQAPAP